MIPTDRCQLMDNGVGNRDRRMGKRTNTTTGSKALSHGAKPANSATAKPRPATD